MRAFFQISSFSTVNRKFFLKFLLTFLFSPWLFAQNALPDLGDVASSSLPQFEQNKIAQELIQQIKRDSSYLNDIDSEFYLSQIGKRLQQAAKHPLPLSFFILQNSSINAFALPGGIIGVYSGLILNSQNESELAGVLAHEIAHVTQNHIARNVYQNKQLLWASLLGLGAAAIAGTAGANSDSAGAALALTQGVVAHKELSFSRDLEREADRIGFETLKQAHFETRAMASFFNRLMNNKNEKNALVYLQTHPLTLERLSDMQNRDSKTPYRQIASSLDFYLIRARLSVLANHPKQAQMLFQNYVQHQRYPNRAAAFYGLALAYLRLNDGENALKNIENALKIEKNPFLISLKAQVLLQQNENEKALVLLKKAMAENLQNSALKLHYADALIQNQQFQAAYDFLNAITPKTPREYQWMAKASLALKQMANYHLALGESALLEGLFSAAVHHFEQGEKLAESDFYKASQIRARLDFAQKRWQESK